MNRFALDTDHATLLYRGNAIVAKHAASRRAVELAISIVTVEETLSGWYAFLRRSKGAESLSKAYARLEDSMKMLCTFQRLPFDGRAAEVYRDLASRKLKVGKMDLRIAASVIAGGDTLVSRNHRDFSRISELKLVDWSK